MKKSLFISLLFVCCAIAAVAMPAKPGWQTVTQSDGTTLKVQTVGNAFTGTILTQDGLAVERGSDGDYYYYSSLTGLSAVRAHEVGQRTSTETSFINMQRGNLKKVAKPHRLSRQQTMFGVGGSNEESGVPAYGQRHIPIILVEFQDKRFNNTREQIIEAMLSGDKSVGQYFRDQSNGIYEPEFDVFGIYTLSQNREYYGGHQGNNNDQRLGSFVTEACQMAAADGVSFKPFDTNNDDYCDVVIVIYAGVGEAQASTTHPEAIWPCNWNLSSASYYGQGGNGAFRPKSGDPYVDTFAVFNELHGNNDNTTTIDGIGTFAHEFGHCLGLPDFYDTGGGGHYGMGYWDIMCSGCYNDNTYTPVGYSAYEKVFMGWVEYITPQPGTYYTLPVWNQKNANTDKAVCIVSDLNPNEYFIFENRRKQGWDQYIDGQGILVTHITYDAERWWYDNPNNEDIQLVTYLPADNTFSYYDESTDLWPQGNNNAVTDNSTPSTKLYMKANGSITGNAGNLGKPVTEIVINNDGSASFWYMKGAATNPVISVSTNDVDFGNVMMNNSDSRTFKVIGQALTGNVTLTLNDPNGVFAINPTVISSTDAANGMFVTATFNPTAIQDYQATVTLSTPGGADVTVNLTGHGLIEGYTPTMLPADEMFINLTKFRADWTDQTPAENVASYTLEVSVKPEVTLLESVDFSDVPDGLSEDGQSLIDISGSPDVYMPAGWSCTSYMFAYGGYLIAGYGGSLISPTYNLNGYDKVTVVLNTESYYYSYYGQSTFEVRTSKETVTVNPPSEFDNVVIVLDCDVNDQIRIVSGDSYTAIRAIDVYAGDLTAVQLNATEQGNATYRLISGITDKFYTVNDLEAGGTFIYKVKALFNDGTESPWSNVEMVTLFENGHGYQPGDVNHDDHVDINDVTRLIAQVLGSNTEPCCPICADVYSNGIVDINDVTALIDKVLGKN